MRSFQSENSRKSVSFLKIKVRAVESCGLCVPSFNYVSDTQTASIYTATAQIDGAVL